jgi:hypothetical protein
VKVGWIAMDNRGLGQLIRVIFTLDERHKFPHILRQKFRLQSRMDVLPTIADIYRCTAIKFVRQAR